MLAVDAKKVVKKYSNGVIALDGLDLEVKRGEIFSLLGPNGAGKSSLINILTTFYKPTSGRVSILGRDLCAEPGFVRSHIACVAQNVSIDNHLSLIENMIFQSRLYKVDTQTASQRIKSLIESFELEQYMKYPVASYSGGIKRRLDIAMNMVSHPDILFLDEPTVGMDVESRKSMWNMLFKIKKEYGTTILLTTHYIEEADQLSDTVCIMKKGRVLVQGTAEELRKFTRQNLIRVIFSKPDEAKKYAAEFEKMNFVNFCDRNRNTVTITTNDAGRDFKSINRHLLTGNAEFDSLEIVNPSLEDIFMSHMNCGKDMKGKSIC